MERIILRNGTRVNWEVTLKDLQDFTKVNDQRLWGMIYQDYGINLRTVEDGAVDPTDTSLQVYMPNDSEFGVRAGTAITSGLHFIDVQTDQIGIPFPTPHQGATKYLSVVYATDQDTPVSVIDGFVFTGSSLTTMSREHASYAFAWNTGPTVSGIVLAAVAFNNAAPFTVDSITDLRASSPLRLKEEIFSDNVLRTDRTYTQRMSGTLSVPRLDVSSESEVDWIEKSTQTGFTFHRVAFADSNYGVAVGDYGMTFRTVNGGIDWTQTTPSGVTHSDVFYGVAASGTTFVTAGYFNKNYKSSDRGQTWSLMSQPIAATSFYGLCSVVLDSDSFLLGGNSGSVAHGSIYRTDNGGTTWTEAVGANFGGNCWDIKMISATVGFAVGNLNRILKTTDGGFNWTSAGITINNPNGATLHSLSFPTSTVGYAVGFLGSIYKTIDGGTTWNLLTTSPTTMDLYGVDFYDTNIGYIVGTNHTIYRTIDGGINWTSEPFGNMTWPTSVKAFTQNKAIVVGWNGLIRLRTDNATLTLLPSTDGGNYTISGDDIRDIKAWRHQQNTDLGTTATPFMIGMGTLGTTNADTGFLLPQTAPDLGEDIEGSSPFGTIATGGNIRNDDGIFATATISAGDETPYLVAKNFGFNIPLDATITGIEARIKRMYVAPSTNIGDTITKLYLNGVLLGNNKSGGSVLWSGTLQESVYGGNNDLWGAGLTVANVNNSTFGIASKFAGDPFGTSGVGKIDYVKLKIYYIVPSRQGIPAALTTEVSAAQTTVQNNLDAHKVSGDHDNRYLMLGGGSQQVTVQKTFTHGLIAQRDGVELNSPNVTAQQSRWIYKLGTNSQGVSDYGSEWDVNLGDDTTPNWYTLLYTFSGDDFIDAPNRDIRARGKKLATEEYVQNRVRTGTFFQSYGVTVSGGTYAGVPKNITISGAAQCISIPQACRVTKITTLHTGVSALNSANTTAYEEVHYPNYYFSDSEITRVNGIKYLTITLSLLPSASSTPGIIASGVSPAFQINATQIVNGVLTSAYGVFSEGGYVDMDFNRTKPISSFISIAFET